MTTACHRPIAVHARRPPARPPASARGTRRRPRVPPRRRAGTRAHEDETQADRRQRRHRLRDRGHRAVRAAEHGDDERGCPRKVADDHGGDDELQDQPARRPGESREAEARDQDRHRPGGPDRQGRSPGSPASPAASGRPARPHRRSSTRRRPRARRRSPLAAPRARAPRRCASKAPRTRSIRPRGPGVARRGWRPSRRRSAPATSRVRAQQPRSGHSRRAVDLRLAAIRRIRAPPAAGSDPAARGRRATARGSSATYRRTVRPTHPPRSRTDPCRAAPARTSPRPP